MRNALIILLLGMVGFLGYRFQKLSTASDAISEVASRETTAPVETRNIEFSVTVAGEITPAEQVSVRPEVNGRIEELPVDIGDKVSKGDLLFRLDDKELKIEIESRNTAINAAKLRLDRAKTIFERNKDLFENDLVSKELFENSKTEYELAANDIERAQKELDLALDRSSRTRIVAPFDCTVLTRPVSIGQAVSGSGGFNSGTEVLTIADLSQMIINAHVNQADVTRLSPDMNVDVEIEAVPGLKIQGRVERISPQATIVNGIKGFSARIMLQEVDPRVVPGMTATITIPVSSVEEAIAVPLAAVYSEEGERYVYVQKGDQFEKREVDVGISDYFYAEILRGLAGSETVAIEPPPAEAILESSEPTKTVAKNSRKSN